jgi:hypothetical protein
MGILLANVLGAPLAAGFLAMDGVAGETRQRAEAAQEVALVLVAHCGVACVGCSEGCNHVRRCIAAPALSAIVCVGLLMSSQAWHAAPGSQPLLMVLDSKVVFVDRQPSRAATPLPAV